MMGVVVVYIAIIFGCGLAARLIRMPALIGFLAAGFILNLIGVPEFSGLTVMSDIRVTLMLFAVGLPPQLTFLARPTGVDHRRSAHAHHNTYGTGFLMLLSLLGAFHPESLGTLAVLALVLSFSSTIFVIKVLQDRGDEQSVYGNICVGVLILQDIVAVAVISISKGEAPSLWSFGLLAIIPALWVVMPGVLVPTGARGAWRPIWDRNGLDPRVRAI